MTLNPSAWLATRRAQHLRALLGLCAVASLSAACATFKPFPPSERLTVSLDWAAVMYELPEMPYAPKEFGQPLFVDSEDSVSSSMLIIPSRDRFIRALDPKSGTLLWQQETRGPNLAQPVRVGEDVVVASLDGRVYRMSLRNGRIRWETEPLSRGGIHAAPTLDGERVFLTTDDDRLIALDVNTGTRVWDRERPRSDVWSDTRVITGQAGATMVDERVLTGFSDGRVAAYSARDGASLWIRDLSGGQTEFTDITSTPCITIDGLAILASFKQGLFGLDAKTGSNRWQVKGEGFGTPATYDGTLYVPTASGKVLAVRASDGDILWTLDGAGGPARMPAVTPRYVIVPLDTALLFVDRLSGRSVKRYDDRYGFSATPEVAYGTVFAQSNSGVLYALGIH